MARPRKYPPEKESQIADQVEKLAGLHCSWSEIAAVTNEDIEYIKKRFSLEYDKGREKGKTKLRHLMWESAKKGNVAIQIWLSKQILGMTDRTEIKDTTPNKTITLNYATNKVKIENK